MRGGKRGAGFVGFVAVGILAALQFGVQRLQSQVANGQDEGKSVTNELEFFDEPHFTVAGVIDTTNLGGHGSSVAIVRNKDSMEKAAAGLISGPSAKSVVRLIDPAVETNLRQEVDREPQNFEANYEFGKLLLDEGKTADALRYLERACRLNPDNSRSSYELARAHVAAGDYKTAQAELLLLLNAKEESDRDKADVHHLLGQVDERLGESLDAVRELERAAKVDPSEVNLFDWGSELLLHHAPEPASEVFQKGRRLFPNSVRMLVALGASWYALGFSDKAGQTLCEASDLNPNDPEPYLFMGKMQATESVQSEAVSQRLERFLRLQPENALANYYYAVSLLKSARLENDTHGDTEDVKQAKSLLLKSVMLDPKLASAYLQLGMIYAEEKKMPEAIAAYEHAIAVDPELEDAHYRMGQAYRQLGEAKKAEEELRAYETIKRTNAEKLARENKETRQFVYETQEQHAATQSP